MTYSVVGLDILCTIYSPLVLLFGSLSYLAINCGVCDSSPPPELNDSFRCENDQAQSPSRDSVGFDINPAMSPVFEKGANERNFGLNVFEEPKEEASWWNVKILCGGGGSSSSN